MQHFLITRFNLINENWHQDGDPKIVVSHSWLERRFTLFEKFCLPSVINQTHTNFKWLLLFDSNTPDEYKDKIEKLSTIFGNLLPIYVDGFSDMPIKLNETIKRALRPETEFIITTRLDNDDLIHANFIKCIQEQYKPQDNLVINLKNGYQLRFKDKLAVVRKYAASYNPYISLVEKRKDFKTVLQKNHEHYNNHQTIEVKKEPLWIQLLHRENYLNEDLDFLKRTNEIDAAEFGLPNLNFRYTNKENAKHNFKNLPKYYFNKLKNNLKR